MTKKSVYVSSTFVDLEKYRLRLKEILERAGYDVESMEKYPAFDQRPKDKCLADVAQCDYYVLILAHRYGYVPPADNLQRKSITELEYKEAVAKKKPILAFVISEDQPWPPKMMDPGSLSSESAIGAFRNHIQENHGVRPFTTEDNLATAVLEALRTQEEEERQTGIPSPRENESIESVRAILKGCYRRAVFTRTHAQMDHEAMFASITECRELVQSKVPCVSDSRLSQSAADLISALEGIEREKDKEPWDFPRIDGYKLEALKRLRLLSQLTGILYTIPTNLTEEVFFSKTEADLPPTVSEAPPAQQAAPADC